MAKRDLVSIQQLSAEEVGRLLALASEMKGDPARFARTLAGRSLGMVFQKSSTRTRVSFEVGMTQLGGHALFLSSADLQLGRGETIADTAQVLSRYVDAIMARVFAHRDVVDLAAHATVPVINGLSDDLHPCQALADYLTLRELFGELRGRRIAYVGDGNNVAHSLIHGAIKVGMEIAVASPPGFRVAERYLEPARAEAEPAGTRIEITESPAEAVAGASAVYTDVWASMGQEEEAAERRQAFAGFTVDGELMSAALPEAVFLHCLPAHRGEEVSAEVMDGPQSRVLDQAENRLHVQKALVAWLLGAAGE